MVFASAWGMVANGAAELHAASIRAHHQDLIQGLIALKPKKRANKVSWVVFGGCAYFIAALVGDHSVREALFAPHVAARAPQYVATAPIAPRAPAPLPVQVREPVQVQPVQVPSPVQPAVLTFDPVAVPAAEAPSPDGPLPHAKAHHTAPTHRAHPRGAKRAK